MHTCSLIANADEESGKSRDASVHAANGARCCTGGTLVTHSVPKISPFSQWLDVETEAKSRSLRKRTFTFAKWNGLNIHRDTRRTSRALPVHFLLHIIIHGVSGGSVR